MKREHDGYVWWDTVDSYFEDNPTREVVFVVSLLEYEKGYGQRHLTSYFFEYPERAKDYCNKYNKEYNFSDPTPSWYIKAEYDGPMFKKT